MKIFIIHVRNTYVRKDIIIYDLCVQHKWVEHISEYNILFMTYEDIYYLW